MHENTYILTPHHVMKCCTHSQYELILRRKTFNIQNFESSFLACISKPIRDRHKKNLLIHVKELCVFTRHPFSFLLQYTNWMFIQRTTTRWDEILFLNLFVACSMSAKWFSKYVMLRLMRFTYYVVQVEKKNYYAHFAVLGVFTITTGTFILIDMINVDGSLICIWHKNSSSCMKNAGKL